ncbi:hypothetical protein ACM01_37825 [Streptomyces viridochromogenes]|uniref:DUF937 domain-containing protein n=1 Tax=Streptomyces viridochromogenes TaxID=1938 RepID=A0A0J7YZD3_STRVR|nr:DUF937 domain-containing protein [Streptomyces viridochromogenes]KMS68772.1 hypothetical protein ACM01_37825 [Streptomyces viridochromogenes]KOG17140.1 hypothetical protein ADK35_25130 [Streptomyces viridochromogenes]KOG20160.1 hypothetical protein ADK36_17790 [Streptomyces viridochromogenes]
MQEVDENPLTALQDDVLDELGDGRIGDIAELLGTDEAGARQLVGTTVAALSGEAETVATPHDAPLTGVATLGGFATGGLMAGLLAEEARPVADAVARKTGLPQEAVSRVVEMVIPVELAVLTKRAAGK